MNDIAVNAPEQLHPGISLKEILAKIFLIQKNTGDAAVAVLEWVATKQDRAAYKELLRTIVSKVNNEFIKSYEQERDPRFGFTEDNWIYFTFDDPVVKWTLEKYDFLKTWGQLDKTKMKERIKKMCKDDLCYKPSIRGYGLTADGVPYLDVREDDGKGMIVLKNATGVRGGEYMDMPSWANSFN